MDKCECCGGDIKRGYGKVCRECEDRVMKNLQECEKAMSDYLKRTK